MNKRETITLMGTKNFEFTTDLSSVAIITPTAGLNLVVNPEFTSDAASWNATAATLNQRDSATTPGAASGGADNGCLEVDDQGASSRATQAVTIENSSFYDFDSLYYGSTGVPQFRIGTSDGGLQYLPITTSVNNTWTPVYGAFLSVGTTAYVSLYSNTGTNGTLSYFDRVRLRKLTTSTCLKLWTAKTSYVSMSATLPTFIGSTFSGVIACVDSDTNPQNFVLGIYDGANARLIKCVGGTYTTLISAAVVYDAGSAIQVTKVTSSDTFQLFYGGVQVGTDQTVENMTGKKHGLFTSRGSNRFGVVSLQRS